MDNQNNKSPFFILFVDDEEKTRKYFEKGLQAEFNVITTDNIEAAKKIINDRSQEIAVVITDQRMVGGNGVKLLNFLRKQYPQIIRLLTTGYSDLTEAIEAVNKGEIFRYIQKPWDYNLLKTELKQALHLFELHLEREKLIGEKIFVRQKMVKIDRLRLLILLSKTLNFLRFTEISAVNFIKQFIAKPRQDNDYDQWQMFELGNQDFLETLLAMDVVENVYKAISNYRDYNFDNSINSEKIKEYFEAESKPMGIDIKITTGNLASNLEINNYGFNVVVKKLLSQIIALGSDSAKLDIRGSEDNENLLINLNIPNDGWPGGNMFIIAPGKLKTVWHIDLLICYLLIGHHGGTVEADLDENKNINYNIKLPFKPREAKIDFKLSDKVLDDIIFLAMLED